MASAGTFLPPRTTYWTSFSSNSHLFNNPMCNLQGALLRFLLVRVKDLQSYIKKVTKLNSPTGNSAPETPRPQPLLYCDITPRHTLHNLCRAAIFACKNWFSTAALLMLAMQLRRVWANQSQQTGHSGRGRALKRQELKTERFKQRGNAELQHWTVWQNWCVFWALRHATCSSSD